MKKFNIIWTKSAEFDLELIIEYIKIDSLLIAKEIFFGIKTECESLYFYPERKRIVPELQQIGIVKYREVIYKRWRIIYKIDNDTIYILLVADSSRNLEDLLFQRLMRNN